MTVRISSLNPEQFLMCQGSWGSSSTTEQSQAKRSFRVSPTASTFIVRSLGSHSSLSATESFNNSIVAGADTDVVTDADAEADADADPDAGVDDVAGVVSTN